MGSSASHQLPAAASSRPRTAGVTGAKQRPSTSSHGGTKPASSAAATPTSSLRRSGPTPVPDFGSLHAAWGRRLAAIKTSNRRRATVPQAFNLGDTAKQRPGSSSGGQHQQEDKEGRQLPTHRSGADADEDGSLPEQRWPFTGSRVRVAPTPPPPPRRAGAAGGPPVKVGGTLSARLKAEAVRRAIAEGRFESPDSRERRCAEAEQAERVAAAARRRAAAALAAAKATAAAATGVWQQRASEAAGAAAAATAAATVATTARPKSQSPPGRDERGASRASGGNASPSAGGSPSSPPRGAAAAAARPRSAVEARRAALRARDEAPVMHREARHAQAAAAARALVEDALLAQGIDALRYVAGA
jgi:hypothetical protein